MLVNGYFKRTKSPLNSAIYVLPLFIIYELGILFLSSDDLPTVRNSVDVLIRNILAKLGMAGIYGIGIILIISLVAVFILNRKKSGKLSLRSTHFLFMLFESLLWAVVLHIFLLQSQLFLLNESNRQLVQQIILAVGSGLFEEFLFRVLLIGIIVVFLNLFFKDKYWYKMTFAVFIAAAVFAYFHFIGEFADEISMIPFMIRFLAGIYLGYIYAIRGFGIVAYTHSFYNLIIIVQQ